MEKGIIDVLLGSDYYHLMFPMQEIRGKEDEPAARLCPLGWTAIGRIGRSLQSKEAQAANTGYLHTFRCPIMTLEIVPAALEPGESLNFSLKRFWDLDTVGIVAHNQEQIGMAPDEKVAWKKVEQSLAYNGERYEVAVPWKNERPNLLTIAK